LVAISARSFAVEIGGFRVWIKIRLLGIFKWFVVEHMHRSQIYD
jgi:hypothetical protein